MNRLAGYALVLTAALAYAQKPPQTAAENVSGQFTDINRKVLAMAQDFPESKYDFRLKPEMRSFAAVIVHVASGNAYAAKAGRGEKVKWDELDPKNYKTKAEVVSMLQKTITDATSALKENPAGPQKNYDPYLSVLEHSAEHYGLLVAYYRANGLVPPESRPKK